MSIIMLLDNGSLRATATLQLRRLAKELSNKVGKEIHPVSFNHSDRIPSKDIEGKPAQIFSQFMTKRLTQGETEFILLPLFFGQSKTLSTYVPKEVRSLKERFGDFELNIAKELYPLPNGEARLTTIINEHILKTCIENNHSFTNIVLVDHGSPLPQVTAVRQHLTQTVQNKLPEGVQLDQAVMERREGKEFDFNGELLQNYLSQRAAAGETHATVILMFLLPGSHAGEDGDIIEICNSVMTNYPHFIIKISPLISEHPEIISILAEHLRASDWVRLK